MKEYKYLFAALCFFAALFAGGQTFNPTDPAEPGGVGLSLAVAPQGAGSVSPGAYTLHMPGSNVNVSVSVNTGFVFQGWIDEQGNIVSTSRSYRFVMPANPVSLTAKFAYDPQSPTEPSTPTSYSRIHTKVKPDGAGYFNISSGTRYEAGQSVFIRAYANSSFVFKGWLLDDEPYQAAQSMYFTVDESDHTLTALFDYSPSNPAEPVVPQLEHTLILKSNPEDGGYFNQSSPYKLKAGERVWISASPNQYYAFSGWTSNDVEFEDASSRSFYFVMPDHSVTLCANYTYYFNPSNPSEPTVPVGKSTLYGRRVSISPGQTVAWPIYLENYSEVVSVTVNITIPDGFIADIDGVQLAQRAGAHTIGIDEIDAGKTYRFNIRGTEPLQGVNGSIFTLPIKAPIDAEIGSMHSIHVTKGVIYKSDGSNEIVSLRDGAIAIVPVPEAPIESVDLAVTSVSVDAVEINPGDSFDVTWAVENQGEVPANGGWTERIALVDVNGQAITLATTAYETGDMAPGDIANRLARVTVPQLPGLEGKLNVRITLIASPIDEEPDSRLSNNVAMTSSSPVFLNKRLILSLPESSLTEGTTPTARCQLARSGNWSTSEEFKISVIGDGRLSAPTSVVIPKNQSASYFYLTLTDNDINDDCSEFKIEVSGSGYASIGGNIVVEDDELPTLKVMATPDEIFEGESFELAITTSRAPASDLVINIACDLPKRFSMPSNVVLQAGQTSVTATVHTIDNSEIETLADATFKVSATGYSPAETYVLLSDNDVPSISLEISPTIVSEGAGPNAVVGRVRRIDKLENTATILISLSPSEGVYTSKNKIVMTPGMEVAEFTIGVIDNAIVDGERDVIVTASVYATSCNCAISQGSEGTVSQSFTITDNDGPSLTLTSSSPSLVEGSNGNVFTVSRNTSTSEALTVAISSDAAERFIFDEIVIIPAGESSASFTVGVVENHNSDDSGVYSFTASANGFSTGSCWVQITDTTLPDAIIKSFTIDNMAPQAGEKVTVSITLANQGAATLASQTSVRVLHSAMSEAVKLYTRNPLEPSEEVTLTQQFELPMMTGRLTFSASVNEDRRIAEQVYNNNTAPPIEIELVSGYNLSLNVEKPIYNSGETVVITGQAFGNITTGGTVEVYVINNGLRQAEQVLVNDNLEFNVNYTPYAKQNGRFYVGACFPGEGSKETMTSFDVYGINIPDSYRTVKVDVGQNASTSVSMSNAGLLDMNGIEAAFIAPENLNITLDMPTEIAAGQTQTATFSIKALSPTDGSDWQQVPVTITSAQGTINNFVLYVYATTPNGKLAASQTSVKTTVTKGSTREVAVSIINQGSGSTGQITIDTGAAAWLRCVTPTVLSPLAPGEEATLVFAQTALDDMQLNNPVTAKAAINCASADGILINFNMEPVGEVNGVLTVDVCDEYTYYTTEAPHLQGATVTVSHPTTKAVIATGISDDAGICSFILPEGYYNLSITEPRHNSHSSVVIVNPGVDTRKVINLSTNAINVSVSYEQTEIEDEYEIVTTVTYETNVPMPVVEVKMPDRVNGDDLAIGQSLMFNVVLTNLGLITAQHTALEFGSLPDDFEVELLSEVGFELAPQQTVVIPVRLTRIAPPNYAPSKAPRANSNGCHMESRTTYDYVCGPDNIPVWVPRTVQVRVCPGSGNGGGSSIGVGLSHNFNITHPNVPAGPGSPVTNPIIPVRPTEYNPPITVSDENMHICNPCTQEFFMKLSKCLGFDPDHPIQSLVDIPGGSCIYDTYNNIVNGNPSREDVARNIGHCALEACKAIGGTLVGIAGATAGGGGVTATAGAVGGAARAICELIEHGDQFYYDCWKPMRTPCSSKNNGGNKAPALQLAEDVDPNADLVPTKPQAGNYPGYISQFQDRIALWTDLVYASSAYMQALIVDEVMYDSDKGQLANMFDTLSLCSASSPANAVELDAIRPDNVPVDNFVAFIDRYNNYLRYLDGQDVQGDMPNVERMEAALNLMAYAYNSVSEMGYDSFDKMMDDGLRSFIEGYDDERASVCASVTLKISQNMTMTRQAIRATLEVGNGHDTDAIRDAKVNFSVTNPDGVLVGSDIMQISTESLKGFKGELALDTGWSLEAGDKGVATILFIPTKNAAPTTPLDYTFNGALTYHDPFSDLEVTRTFSPATLTVNPSPIIDLHYFMQRDIMGDDPITIDVVEPKIPGEFAVMVKNKGYGNASNVRFVTKQPEIADNSKGLMIDFAFVGSSLAGGNVNPVLSEKIPTEFGDIAAHTTTYAQWWLECSLMGHFVSYDVSATHLTSYGNEDLSLLDQVEIHELIHGFTPETKDESILRAFLVNDIADSYDAPDMVYSTDGQDATPVNTYVTAKLSRISDDVWHLSATSSYDGWNYGCVPAEGLGKRHISKIVRISDNKELNADNFWTSYATLNDAHEPLYEDKLHFITIGSGLQEYDITFEKRPDIVLSVESFSGLPSQEGFVTTPLQQLTVNFNKAIDPSTFSSDDITLYRQGYKLDSSKIKISSINNQSFVLDLSELTPETGFYIITVNTAEITDIEGYNGENGASASWVQVIDGLVNVNINVNPVGGAKVSPASGQYPINELITLCAIPTDGYEFSHWSDIDGNIISYDESVKVTPAGDCTYTAFLSIRNYTLEINNNISGGSIIGHGSGIYPHGSTISLRAVPDDGWRLDYWIIDGNEVYDASTLEFAIDAPHSISASFTEMNTSKITYIRIDSELKIVPLPITRYAAVLADELEYMTVEFYDIAGHLKLRFDGIGSRMQMDVSHLPVGVYIVKIESPQGIFTRKALKK